MTPEQAKKLLADGVIQAFAEGRRVQWRMKDGVKWWMDSAMGDLSFDSNCEYRVKPEPRRVWVRFGSDDDDSPWSVWSCKEMAEKDGFHAVEFVEVMKP